MLKPGDCVLVAVSGGPDSVCLLNALWSLSKEFAFTLHIAHLDHMFRGRESADEALFVAGLAKKLGVPAVVEKIDVPAFCRERGLSSQEGARTVRYDFLQNVAKTAGATRIATGHTADDQAETFLMRLLRGAGVSGLSAIPPVRDNIIRPLIDVTRGEVMAYIREHGLEFATDPSNAQSVYMRNRIRRDLLPLLRHFNPRVVETLSTEAELLRDENEAMEACLAERSGGILRQEPYGVVLERASFNALPQAFKRRLFLQAVQIVDEDISGLTRQNGWLSSVQIDEAVSFMKTARSGRVLQLPGNVRLEREYEAFIVSRETDAQVFSRVLTLPGVTRIPELGLQAETAIAESPDEDFTLKNYLWQAEFDYDKIHKPLVLRSRLSGDRFYPSGMGGRSKKLQDYFTDEKVPRRKRNMIPLLVSGEDIVWVVGFRTDARFLPGAGAKRKALVGIQSMSGER